MLSSTIAKGSILLKGTSNWRRAENTFQNQYFLHCTKHSMEKTLVDLNSFQERYYVEIADRLMEAVLSFQHLEKAYGRLKVSMDRFF